MKRVSLQDQIKCARRELALRGRVYPRQVRDGRMTREKADSELAAMEAIVVTLELLAVPATHVHRDDGFLDRIDSMHAVELREVVKRLCDELALERQQRKDGGDEGLRSGV